MSWTAEEDWFVSYSNPFYLYHDDFISYDEHDGNDGNDEQQASAQMMSPEDWPELWALAEECDWEGVSERLDSNPEEVQIFMGQWQYGCSFLHFGLELNMPSALAQKVASISPDALSMHIAGNLPLHFILSRGNWTPSEIKVIVKGYPEGVSMWDSFQRLPLHILMNKYPIDTDDNLETMRILLDVAPDTAMTESGSVGYHNNAWTRILNIWNTNFSDNLWEMTKLILYARFVSRLANETSSFLSLHAAIQEDSPPFSCSENLWNKLMKECGDEAKVRMNDNILPLSYCIQVRHLTWEKGLKTIFEAAPLAALTRDRVTRLYPFQLAACCCGNSDLNSIYELCKEWSGNAVPGTSVLRNV